MMGKQYDMLIGFCSGLFRAGLFIQFDRLGSARLARRKGLLSGI